MDLRAPEEVERFGEPSFLRGAEVIQHSRESTGRWSPVVVGTPSPLHLVLTWARASTRLVAYTRVDVGRLWEILFWLF